MKWSQKTGISLQGRTLELIPVKKENWSNIGSILYSELFNSVLKISLHPAKMPRYIY